ncbi:hypothetical protein ES703_104729 [subsurface metagenome]
MVSHRLVEIYGRAAGDIKAGHPHGADKDDTEKIIRVFELGIQIFFNNTFAVRDNIESLFLHLIYFVL